MNSRTTNSKLASKNSTRMRRAEEFDVAADVEHRQRVAVGDDVFRKLGKVHLAVLIRAVEKKKILAVMPPSTPIVATPSERRADRDLDADGRFRPIGLGHRVEVIEEKPFSR